MDAVPLPAFFDLVEYWEVNPPAHLMLRSIALAFGMEQKGGKAGAKRSSPADIEALVTKFQK